MFWIDSWWMMIDGCVIDFGVQVAAFAMRFCNSIFWPALPVVEEEIPTVFPIVSNVLVR